jgi:hypothetical protein
MMFQYILETKTFPEIGLFLDQLLIEKISFTQMILSQNFQVVFKMVSHAYLWKRRFIYLRFIKKCNKNFNIFLFFTSFKVHFV